MRKLFYGIGAVILLVVLLAITGLNPKKEVAVIISLQHRAMDAIVEGLKGELGEEVVVHVYNAQEFARAIC